MRMATRQAVAKLRPERVAADFDALLHGLVQARGTTTPASTVDPPGVDSPEQELP
jgi:hypothetical protein